jgi:integrase
LLAFTCHGRTIPAHTRRYLLWEEWHWLKHGPNAVLYQTAIQTGYRVAELAALTPASLGPDFLRLAAGHTKNGQDAKQYITPDLAAQLNGCLPFELPWDGAVYRTARLLRDDLAAARAKYESEATNPDKWLLRPTDAAGRVLDFHALRHTCGAWLALAGCQPKVIQSVMRHSSITLTFDTYGHLFPGAERDAVAHFAGM